MSYNQEIAPWQTFNEDEPILNSLRKVSKSHRRSMILPPSVPLHPSGSPRMQLASPEIDHQTESQSPKNPLNSLRFKRLSLAEVVNKKISGEDMLVIPPINYNSVEFHSVPRLYGEHDLQVKSLTKRRIHELEQIINERKEKQDKTKQIVAQLEIIPEIKSVTKLDRRYKSKSLNTLHNHIKYYKDKNRQKQNQNAKADIVKFDSLQDIIKRLPKIDTKSERKYIKSTEVVVKSQTFQTIKFMEPFEKIAKMEKKSIVKGKNQHILDKLFEKMVERKREGQ